MNRMLSTLLAVAGLAGIAAASAIDAKGCYEKQERQPY